VSEATQRLQKAKANLGPGDSSTVEADLYLELAALSKAVDAHGVQMLESSLLTSVLEMKRHFGADSMVLSLGLSQHDRLVTQALSRQGGNLDPRMCEALLKQHSALLEAQDPSSEDLAISEYKLATFLYTQNLLQDASVRLQKAASLLRSYYSDGHPLLQMCKHRQGMICAASGDHRCEWK
jgi:hypothetical protein